MTINLEQIHEEIDGLLPKLKTLYLVVPEARGYAATHYQYNGFIYPKAGVQRLLPWTEANEGELMYSKKVLRAIEKGMQNWVVWNAANDRRTHPDGVWPEVRLVMADYEGRRRPTVQG